MGVGRKRVFQRLGGVQEEPQNKVCYHWLAGRCNRNPCHFLHIHPNQHHQSHDFAASKRRKSLKWVRDCGVMTGTGGLRPPPPPPPPKVQIQVLDKICKLWVSGKCASGENCKFQHQWFVSESFSMLTQLTGHTKAISAITSPMGSDKLYSGSKDESVRVWDCQTGHCAAVVKLEGEVGCMINEGPWIFIGLPNTVKAWNTQTNAEISLSGPVGQVCALIAHNGMLFAGIQDGTILVWRFTTDSFEPAASLTGHTLSVVSFVVGAYWLYSGSMDKTIRRWDLDTLQCIQTLTEHTSVVTSVLCWEQFLISCSLDQTIKVWAASKTESGSVEVIYTHKEEHGVLGLCGVYDAQAKPVLLCSYNDNTVRFYDLPSFRERGKIFSSEEIPIIQPGSDGGLFFTGDGTGELKVWKWSESKIALNE